MSLPALKYEQVRRSIDEKESELSCSESVSEDEPFIHTRHSSPQSSRKWLPWILCALLSASNAALLFHLLSYPTHQSGIRVSNEFIDPATIPLEEIKFSGSPNFSPNGTMEHKPKNPAAKWPENVTYVGPPSPALDENWEQLIKWRYFSISEEEAKTMFPENYNEYVDQLQGGYTAGLDVFHTLHCVNAIRKALHPTYYNTTWHNDPPHIDHCLDIIRQYVQCAGITTLVPTRFFDGLRRNYIDSDQTHTCRSFKYLREWTNDRQSGRKNYAERNLGIVDAVNNHLAHQRLEEIDAGNA